MDNYNILDGVFTADNIQSYGEPQSAGYMQVIGSCTIPSHSMTYTYWPYNNKSAREQVQDEILTKMAEAISANDLKQAKKLVELAKALKEL